MTLRESLESKGIKLIQWDGKSSVKGLSGDWVFDALPYIKYKFAGRTVVQGDYLCMDETGQARWLIHKKDFECIERMLQGDRA